MLKWKFTIHEIYIKTLNIKNLNEQIKRESIEKQFDKISWGKGMRIFGKNAPNISVLTCSSNPLSKINPLVIYNKTSFV